MWTNRCTSHPDLPLWSPSCTAPLHSTLEASVAERASCVSPTIWIQSVEPIGGGENKSYRILLWPPHVWVYMHVCMHTRTHTHIHTLMHVHAHTYMSSLVPWQECGGSGQFSQLVLSLYYAALVPRAFTHLSISQVSLFIENPWSM